jgi:N-formylmaleamate deformylase
MRAAWLIAIVVLTSAPAVAAPRTFTVEVSGSGRPIVFIPGLGCPGSVWAETVKRTPGEHHVVTVAGFAGTAPVTTRPLLEAIRAELAQYIRERKLDHPVLVGHSMGGFLALWLAATEPGLASAVVSVDSAPTLGAGDPDLQAMARTRRDRWRGMTDAAFARAVRELFGGMFREPARHEAVLAAVARSDRALFADVYLELFTVDIRKLLPQIQIPVLAVLADGPNQALIRRQLAGVKPLSVVVVPRARHFVMLDDPAAFYVALDKVVGGVKP